MKRLAMSILMIGLLMMAGTVSAMTHDGAIFDIDCYGFYSNAGGLIMDRDNTGTGREHFVITAYDGAGNVLYTYSDDFLVGGSLYFDNGGAFYWTHSPTVNPLTVQVVSPAGNGLPEQLVYTHTESCPTLPDSEPQLDDAQIIAPVLPAEAIGVQPGYLIVNTFRQNVRSGDGLEYTIIGQVNGGTRLTPLGVNEERSWFYVQAGNVRGWVRSDTDLLITRGDLRDTPILQAQGTILPPRFFVYIHQNVYSRPSTISVALCEIVGNREYVIDRVSYDHEWYGLQVTCDGVSRIGWISVENGALRNLGNVEIPVME